MPGLPGRLPVDVLLADAVGPELSRSRWPSSRPTRCCPAAAPAAWRWACGRSSRRACPPGTSRAAPSPSSSSPARRTSSCSSSSGSGSSPTCSRARTTPGASLVPAVITALGALIVGLSPRLLRALGKRGQQIKPRAGRGRVRKAVWSSLAAVADGVDQAKALLRHHSFGVVVGSLAYMAFDIAALGAAFAATSSVPHLRHPRARLPDRPARQPDPAAGRDRRHRGRADRRVRAVRRQPHRGLGRRAPLPALPALRPAVLGVPAFVLLRRTLMRADHPAAMCAPLALDVVKIPARSTT